MSILITSWECDELLEHLRSRSDIWTVSDENPLLWLRSIDDHSCCAVQFSDVLAGPLPLRTVSVLPIEWDETESTEYLSELLTFWTEYGMRARLARFLTSELKIDAETAELATLGLAAQEHETATADPENEPPLVQEPLWPSGFLPPPEVLPRDPLHVGIWNVQCGLPSQKGTVSLRRCGGQLRIELALVDPHGFGVPALKGFVAPTSGNIPDAISRIQGGVHETTTPSPEPELMERLHELQEAVRVEESGGAREPREEERLGDRNGDASSTGHP